MANRFDVFHAKIPQKDKFGFLVVDSTPTRSGVFKYFDYYGKEHRELRHPDEVFSRETLDSMNGIIYTTVENHLGIFTPKDTKDKTYGFTLSDARKDQDHSRVSIKIINESEINAIEGKDGLELSMGYICDVIPENGEFNGERYDAVQKNIRYNHIARVKNDARGGETCRIRLDSKSAICGIEAERIDSDKFSKTYNKEENSMTTTTKIIELPLPEIVIGSFRLDSDSAEFPAEQEGVIKQFRKREESLIKALKENAVRLDEVNAKLETGQAKIDVLEKENKDLKDKNANSIPKERLDSAVNERASFLSHARDFKIEKANDLSNDEIIVEIAKKSKKAPDESKLRLDNMAYTTAVFDMAIGDIENQKKKIESDENLEFYKSGQGDGKVSNFDQAKKRRA